MAQLSLKALHAYLRLIENASELKRKIPTSYGVRTIREELYEIGSLADLDEAVFKDPQNVGSLVGTQRFAMIWGEPSVSDHVARVLDSTKVLLTAMVNPEHFGITISGSLGPVSGNIPGSEPETVPSSLKPMLSGNAVLTCKLFRALFEHVLGFTPEDGAQQGTVWLVNQLIGTREHSRSFLSTALFILGAELDRDHLIPFMVEQELVGMQTFGHLLQNRDYCNAFYIFRRLERAFIDAPADEEARLRDRMNRFNAQFGGKSSAVKIFEAGEEDKARVDAYSAAADLLEALALTPWSLSLSQAVAVSPVNSVRSVRTIARHFERYAQGAETKEQANREITDHLLAFSRQFSPPGKSV